MCCYSAVRRTLLAEFSSSFRSFYLFSRRRSHQQLFRSNRRFFCMANEPPATPPPKRTKKEIADTSDNNGTDVSIVDTLMTKRLKVCKSVTDFKFDKKRVRLITSNADMPEICKGIAYWMWREQRVQGEPKNMFFTSYCKLEDLRSPIYDVYSFRSYSFKSSEEKHLGNGKSFAQNLLNLSLLTERTR